MPSFNQTFSFSEPTVVLPPSQLTHPFHHQPFNPPPNLPNPSKASLHNKTSTMSSWTQKAQTTQTPITNCRKRSRDEAAPNLTDDEDDFASSPILATENEDEWQYGEGMVLIKPKGFIIDAGSQTGTWAEEKATEERDRAHQQIATERPIVRHAKSQRLDQSATSMIVEETPSTSTASSPPKSSTEPTVDDFTIHLGIGWNRISDDEHIQAAARGWAKFVENNYPVTAPIIQLESRGLSSYLVEAKEGFFLFAEDLKQGRLVSTDFAKTVQNLQVRPPIFDASGEIMIARSEIPAHTANDEKSQQQVNTTAVEIANDDTFLQTTTTTSVPNSVDVEMDLN